MNSSKCLTQQQVRRSQVDRCAGAFKQKIGGLVEYPDPSTICWADENEFKERLMPTHKEVEVRAVQQELGEALTHKDLDRAISLMTIDVTLLGSKGPPLIGRDAARRLYADLFDRFNITVANAHCTVEVIGDAAVTVGQQTTSLVPLRGGRPMTLIGRVVGVYRRDGGSWKLARAVSVFTGSASTGGIPAHRHLSELLRRAQAEPGQIIYPEVA
jgi:uncharacterized protein (TIGR02246 family)